MRINSEVYQKRIDAFGEIRIPNCEPQQLKVVTERLMQMIIDREKELDATPYQYNTVTELDKLLTVDYWERYDNLLDCLGKITYGFKEWYTIATDASLIERGRRWLIAHRYIFLKQGVADRAQEAGENFSRAVKQK